MAPSNFPLVDAGEIIRMVGDATFARGRGYSTGGAVLTLDWDPRDHVLTGTVLGNSPQPYVSMIGLEPATGSYFRPVFSYCDCPVSISCKHVVALLLTSNALHAKESVTAAAPIVPMWKAALGSLVPREAQNARPTTPLALQFELREIIPRSRSRWDGPAAKTADATSLGAKVDLRLAVRPVVQSHTGNWVRSGVTWNAIEYQGSRLNAREDQVRWFTQFAALHRSTRQTYGNYEPDWLYLDDFESALVWQLFREAQQLQIPCVASKKGATITFADEATLSLDIVAGGADPAAKPKTGAAPQPGAAPLHLRPTLLIDSTHFSLRTSATIGNHGLYSWSLEPQVAVTVAPTSAALTAEQHTLFGHADDVTVPADDVDEFLRDYFPRLRKTMTVTNSDASVPLPEIVTPVLVLTVKFTRKHTLSLDWHWAYGELTAPLVSLAGSSAGGTTGGIAARDETAEQVIIDRLRAMLDAQPAVALRAIDTQRTNLQGIAAAEFVHSTLPLIEALDEVQVDTVGTRPDYRELTDVPQLAIKTVETDSRDWFDLGVYVTVEGRDVPFSNLFTALSKGQTKLLLVDNTYLSLEQPMFDELRRLIDEASTLGEWETGVRISRYQSSLWSEFEDLADETEQAIAWREAASGLNAIESVAPTPLPAQLTATLRPYQHEGFNWLAFLWQHRLGGVLADDMGLGKTLQTLALIAHADADQPFLVVAPTSVVANWQAEAARFVPGLSVATITSTKQDLAARAAGAQIVVTSYALFRIGFAHYQALGWAGLILDEAQFVKNAASKAHGCAVDLHTSFKLAITGTPIENSLTDLWSLFQIVAPGLFPSARRFAEEYVRPIDGGDRPELVAKLRRRIRPLMMRRTKELVATELPAKQEQVLQVELGVRHRKLYDTFLQKERQKLLGLIDDLDKNRFIVFRSITLLRMLSLDASLVDEKYSDVPSAKLDALCEQLDDVVAEGHRALVFSQFTSFLKKAAERMTAAGIAFEYLDGSTLKRADVIARFRSGDAPVFLISLKAGGFGLNLTEADYVFLLDPWWNPATETQAIDRTHRIGQTRSVNVYRLVSTGTIEEKVMALKEKKAKLFDAVMDDDAVFSSTLTADDIRSLLN